MALIETNVIIITKKYVVRTRTGFMAVVMTSHRTHFDLIVHPSTEHLGLLVSNFLNKWY